VLAERQIQKVVPIKGWVRIPSGSVENVGSSLIGRPQLITISGFQSSLLLDHEVTVSEYNIFRAWINDEAPSLRDDVTPLSGPSSAIPADYFVSSTYKKHPAIGLSPFQIALFCSWVDYLLSRAYRADEISASFTEYLSEELFWSNIIDRGELMLEFFRFSRPVNLYLTTRMQVYCIQKNGGDYAYNLSQVDTFLEDVEELMDLVPAKKAKLNRFKLHGAGSNAAEPYALVSMHSSEIDLQKSQPPTGRPVEIRKNWVGVRGLKPAESIQLQFLKESSPPSLYGFRISISLEEYFPELFENVINRSDF
jgi:hypothetical protein